MPGAVSPGKAGTREEASAPTASKPEDAQVLLAALQHLFLLDEGRCWSLPSVALAGVERGAIGEFILQVRACPPTSSPQIYRQGNGPDSSRAWSQSHSSLVAELTRQKGSGSLFLGIFFSLWVQLTSRYPTGPGPTSGLCLWEGGGRGRLSHLHPPWCSSEILGACRVWVAWLPVTQSSLFFISVSFSSPCFSQVLPQYHSPYCSSEF